MATAVTPETSTRNIGWALLAIALLSPVAMGAVGVLSAFKVGELVAQVGFAWIGSAIVIDLLTRKRGVTAKANGRIVSATLALVLALVSGFNSYRDTQKVDTAKKEMIEQFMASTVEARSTNTLVESAPGQLPATAAAPPLPEAAVQNVTATNETDRTVGFLNAMKARAKKFAEDSGAIDRKFNAVDLSTVLVAQNLVSKPSIEASRKKLNTYRAVIGERDAMLKQHFVLSEQIIRGFGLSEREVNEGMAGLNSGRGPVTQNYADLTSAQLASVTAVEAVLNLVQRGLGHISVENGQPMFQTQPELDEYRRLMQVLTDAAAAETVVTQKVVAQTQKSKQALVEQLK